MNSILFQSDYWKMLPMAILGVLAICGSLANMFLPDTLNMPMPQTLEDGENFGKDVKIFSKPRRKASEC
jgi:MFS transporter, OCT family, solute carrier family 22 (organic cation transporter), member 4/5